MTPDSTEVAPLDTRDRWVSALSKAATKPPSMRIFGMVMLVGFGILGGLLLLGWGKTGSPFRLGAGAAMTGTGALIFVWSLVSPSTLPPVYRAWLRFGQALGTVVSTVLLAVMYYAVVTPVGLLMRLTGTDPLERRMDRTAPSYWRTHARPAKPDAYHHMS